MYKTNYSVVIRRGDQYYSAESDDRKPIIFFDKHQARAFAQGLLQRDPTIEAAHVVERRCVDSFARTKTHPENRIETT